MAIDAISSGMRPPQGVDPNQYAQQYAEQNGISVDEAKEQLKAKFGDPQQPGGSSAVSNALSSGDVTGTGSNPSIPKEAWELQALGIPLEVIQEGDNAIKQFADDNNIKLPEKTQGASINFES
ncbi:MAG: hypothetical protein K6A44_00665 [bacterium]|nr:hypothetical protein [bacterium]